MAVAITLNPVVWSALASKALAGATGTDPTYTLADLQREVLSGAATLYEVVAGANDNLGFVVLWVEDFGGTRELVIQSGAALGHDAASVAATLPALAAFARSHHCASMRAHVSDGRMMGLLKRGGFAKAETVMRKEV